MQTATSDFSTTIDQALVAIQEIFTTFLEQPDADAKLVDLFGEGITPSLLATINALIQNGTFADFITVAFVVDEVLDGAISAYIADANTVYVAQDFLAHATPEEVVSAVLQQVGYAIDSVVNEADTPGNEGILFESLVTGKPLNAEQLDQLQAENNVAELTIEDAVVSAEVTMPSVLGDAGDLSSGVGGESGTNTPRRGGKGRDRFRGDANADEMHGGGGRDRLSGAGGNDYMDGGKGHDVLKGGDGDDELLGGGGRDRMSGGAGDDLLYGGGGRDRMSGGDGADTFVYNSMKERGDLILDFDPAADVLDISGLLSELGYDGTTFADLNNNVIVWGQTQKGARLSIDADGLDGAAKPKTLAILKGVDATDLSASNFNLVAAE